MPVLLPLVPLIASEEHKGSSDGVWGRDKGMREIGMVQVSGNGVALTVAVLSLSLPLVFWLFSMF